MGIAFAAGFGAVVQSVSESERFYGDGLGIAFEEAGGDYPHTSALPGLKHFGLWSLKECARACFGTDEWPVDRIAPQGAIEFDVETVEEVESLCKELEAKGFELLVQPKLEPWGQTIARLQSPEGLLIGVGFTPWMH
jgi:catechol 2,3-dioxygenase-like lactoylglutathione lyase family enzyme